MKFELNKNKRDFDVFYYHNEQLICWIKIHDTIHLGITTSRKRHIIVPLYRRIRDKYNYQLVTRSQQTNIIILTLFSSLVLI